MPNLISHSLELRLGNENALVVLKHLVSENPSAPIGYFEKSQECEGGFKTVSTLIGFDPLEEHTCKNENPFSYLADTVERYKALAFRQGGVLGYISYESVRHLEPILKNHQGSFKRTGKETGSAFVDGQFVVFKKWIQFDYAAKTLTLIDLDAQPDFSSLQSLLKRPGKVTDFSSVQSEELKIESLSCAKGREAYVRGVGQLKENIAAGDIFQAVLAEKFETTVSVSPIQIFETLVASSVSAYQFYLNTGDKVFLGASPEMLLQVKGRDLETHPIAGTRPRGRDPQDELRLENELRQDVKENAEHLMLVDLGRNDMGRVSEPGSVRVPERCRIKKFPGVIHLVSRVTGKLRQEISTIRALASFFPAGTLSGAPKVRAMQLLSELENLPRGFYGGAFAFVDFSGDLESCITIRSLEIQGKKVSFQAGAGIVADSVPDLEYDEILHKTQSLRKVLGQAEKIFGGSK